jgi:hypothetical protein
MSCGLARYEKGKVRNAGGLLGAKAKVKGKKPNHENACVEFVSTLSKDTPHGHDFWTPRQRVRRRESDVESTNAAPDEELPRTGWMLSRDY